MKFLAALLVLNYLESSVGPLSWAGSVQVYPAPAGEALSKDFVLQVEGKQIPVYVAGGAIERAIIGSAETGLDLWRRWTTNGEMGGEMRMQVF